VKKTKSGKSHRKRSKEPVEPSGKSAKSSSHRRRDSSSESHRQHSSASSSPSRTKQMDVSDSGSNSSNNDPSANEGSSSSTTMMLVDGQEVQTGDLALHLASLAEIQAARAVENAYKKHVEEMKKLLTNHYNLKVIDFFFFFLPRLHFISCTLCVDKKMPRNRTYCCRCGSRRLRLKRD
jgi:hypothetical protein